MATAKCSSVKTGLSCAFGVGTTSFKKPLPAPCRKNFSRSRENQRQVTYQTVGRDFFVVSGYEPVRVSGADFGQRIFYLKKIVRPSLQAGFEFVYPANRRDRYDRDVEAISPFPAPCGSLSQAPKSGTRSVGIPGKTRW
jgi:hypothetical protein